VFVADFTFEAVLVSSSIMLACLLYYDVGNGNMDTCAAKSQGVRE